MTVSMIIRTLFEIAMLLGVVWCAFHEDRLIALERRIFAPFKRKKLTVVKAAPARSEASCLCIAEYK